MNIVFNNFFVKKLRQCSYVVYLILSFISFFLLSQQPVSALSHIDTANPVNDAAIKLVQFCKDPKIGLDEHAVSIILDYVMNPKQGREFILPKYYDSTGAYYEFDTKIDFKRFIEYSYNAQIPPVITRPSSLRYSIWSPVKSQPHKLPGTWKTIPPGGNPVIIHGIQNESDTPDLNTGVYHEYDLKRTLIQLNHKGRQALISISKQIKQSEVGKKGIILGNDKDWTYYYSGEEGTAKTGLGWAKTYIYDFFSIAVNIESSDLPGVVKTGVFQWLRAGWIGLNFVKPAHIIAGMKRVSRDCIVSLESPQIPAPEQLISVYQWLANLPVNDLNKKYAVLQREQVSSAVSSGKVSKQKAEEDISYANISKEQILQELMLEYLKAILGKTSIIGKRFFPPNPTPLS
ncbi:MAG TPA: hypothetical protein PLF87_03855 [Syntrophorhabdaceae bacterium]|jgi:hypothetical protein|nr:hypothetical protein [Syntrophorhabdaceae bacterium]MDI9561361.1 hypothetical protein [Pseudomonadota bacterium]MBV6505824.1 hypothetical protein [Syntrophorhabdaceae bacterium]HNQ62795.1 hypothetical protein [Syntrophorhabdaceae bacterium]HNZ58798.1 hypothetical protein [Syntrophorhabdaceae bacterium]